MLYPWLQKHKAKVPQTCAYEHCLCKGLVPVDNNVSNVEHTSLYSTCIVTLLWMYESQAKHHTERSANDSTIL